MGTAAGIQQRKLWSVSPSQVDQYKKCARLWYNAYVLGDRAPTPKFMAKGTAVHAALEHYHRTGEVMIELEVADAPGEKWPVMEFVQAAIPHIPKPLKDPYWDQWPALASGKSEAGLMLEQDGSMGTYEGGPEWKQFLDLVEVYSDRAVVTDYKTSSSSRYAKTPHELSVNGQLVANARWLFSVSDYKTITLRHLYLITSGKRPKALPVEVEVTREHVDAEWQKLLVTVREMVEWAKLAPATADPLPPTVTQCSVYGGCYYRPKCGFVQGNSPLTQIGRKPMGTLLDTMMANANKLITPAAVVATATGSLGAVSVSGSTVTVDLNKKPAPAPAKPLTGLAALMAGTPVPGAAPVVEKAPVAATLTPAAAHAVAVASGYPETFTPALGIVPPDAPSPVSTPEEIAAANPPKEVKEEPKAKRGRKKAEAVVDEILTVAEHNPAPVQVNVTLKVDGEKLAETTTTIPAREDDELTKARAVLNTPDTTFACGTEVVFIDCLPGKGYPGEAPRDLAEFMHAFNNVASASANAVDYRLIRYESKGYLAAAIRVYMKALPKAVYVDSRMSGADVFLECVIPYARMIFRGTR